MVSLLCSIALVALPVSAADKTEISERGGPHFEAQLPTGSRIALHIRSGAAASSQRRRKADRQYLRQKQKQNRRPRYRFTSSPVAPNFTSPAAAQ